MNGRKLMSLMTDLELGPEACRTLPAEHLFDTPLAPALKGILRTVTADHVLELDQRRAWLKMKKRGEDLDAAECDRLLELDNVVGWVGCVKKGDAEAVATVPICVDADAAPNSTAFAAQDENKYDFTFWGDGKNKQN